MIESHFPCTTPNIQRISTLLYIVTLCLKFPLILSPRLSQCDLIYISHNQLEIVVLYHYVVGFHTSTRPNLGCRAKWMGKSITYHNR